MSIRIRRLLLSLGILCLFVTWAQSQPKGKQPKGPSQPKPRNTLRSSRKPANAGPIAEKMVAYLAKEQKNDGGWHTNMSGTNGRVVVTSFCALALKASGKVEYQEKVKKAAAFVAKNIFDRQADKDPKWNQTNWGVGIGTTFLCEFYSDTKEAEIKKVLEKMGQEIAERQEPSGGWGHGPHVPCALNYLELMGCGNWMLVACGMLQRAGFQVPGEVIRRGMSYVNQCSSGGHIGYSHRPGQKGIGGSGRTGGTVFAYSLLGQPPGIMGPALQQTLKDASETHGSIALGMLAAALGSRQLGASGWDAYVGMHFDRILGQVQDDGSARHLEGTTPLSVGADKMMGTHYNTGIFALILQLDLGWLNLLATSR